MVIQVLSDNVISRIAAGEVVERPASVVKELIENSIDAGATSITIEAMEGGRRLIRISDNGSGIPVEEVELAFFRHATSKLTSIDDLTHLLTLGFRGEALASIASVSRLTVNTRFRDESAGTRMRIEGGDIVQRQAVGVPAGTVIAIENIFYNTPARLKFMKAESTEKRHITTVVTRYAMAYPDIRFTLIQDEREVFRSSGRGQLADVVVKVFGLDSFKQMVEVDREESPRNGPLIRVRGFVSDPGLSRADRTRIILFINGRSIQDSSLSHAVTQAFHGLLDSGRYPYAVLMIDVPPDFVDVNVHPTKSEVRFQDASSVFVSLQRAIRQTILESVDPMRFHRQKGGQGGEWGGHRLRPERDLMDGSIQMDLDLDVQDPGRFPEREIDEYDDDDPTSVPYGPGAPARPRTLPPLRVVGQIGATYIVAEGPAGLYLIDQHNAHTRVLYEESMTIYRADSRLEGTDIEPITLELTAGEARLLETHLRVFNDLGFEIELFGATTFMIRGISTLMLNEDIPHFITALLVELSTIKPAQYDAIPETVLLRMCQQASAKAGQILTIVEMQSVVYQLERCPSPHSSPEGHPTLIHMSAEQLAREFKK